MPQGDPAGYLPNVYKSRKRRMGSMRKKNVTGGAQAPIKMASPRTVPVGPRGAGLQRAARNMQGKQQNAVSRANMMEQKLRNAAKKMRSA
jgi:hypothetical protein